MYFRETSWMWNNLLNFRKLCRTHRGFAALHSSVWDRQCVCVCVSVRVWDSLGWDHVWSFVCAAVAPPNGKVWRSLPHLPPPQSIPNTRTRTHAPVVGDDLPVPLPHHSASNFSFIQTQTAFPSSVFNPWEMQGGGTSREETWCCLGKFTIIKKNLINAERMQIKDSESWKSEKFGQ